MPIYRNNKSHRNKIISKPIYEIKKEKKWWMNYWFEGIIDWKNYWVDLIEIEGFIDLWFERIIKFEI